MKIPFRKIVSYVIFASVFVVLIGKDIHSDQSGVVKTYKNANTPFDDSKVVDSAFTLPKNTVLVRTKYKGGRFWTESRKDRIERFKCSQCHNNKEVTIARSAEMAHGDIKLDHGGAAKPLSCFTCHEEGARDFLTTEKGITIDMDHSYKMCGQCHFRQERDWVGGAHGKRISFWAGNRVVKNCVSCHDPHTPLFKKQWPVTYSPPLKK